MSVYTVGEPLFRRLVLCTCAPGIWHGEDSPLVACCEICDRPLLAVSLSLLMDRYHADPSADLGSMLEELDAAMRTWS